MGAPSLSSRQSKEQAWVFKASVGSITGAQALRQMMVRTIGNTIANAGSRRTGAWGAFLQS